MRGVKNLCYYISSMLKKCNAGKYKLRINKFRVTWYVYCEVLSNVYTETLIIEDNIIYVK